MTKEELSALDRGTLQTWKVGNIVLWSLGALVVAVAVSFGADILFVDVLDAAIDPFTGGGVVPTPVAAIGTALLVGGCIGLVIGSRVYRARVIIAIAVTVFYLLFVPFAFLSVYSDGPVWTTIALATHIAAAAAVARLFESRFNARRAAVADRDRVSPTP